ncbi:LutC/YkgG family protein [Hippea alviniae]|uniref:LutC/YkgG family protein n=1 Tax=Hippea alviniae TaxID=1279027 RepID=UPI0003B5C6D8|nr:LUD domain-containing protein [Hippea alviniae]
MEEIELFMEFSKLVGNDNKIVERVDVGSILEKNHYDFIHIPSLNLESIKIVEKEGIDRTIVEACLGIAETGSVVLCEDSEEYRRATALCDDLHVILPASRIVRRMEDAASILKDITSKDGGSYAVFITGASRTADIEMFLTLGVHGPKSMKIFIVKDL